MISNVGPCFEPTDWIPLRQSVDCPGPRNPAVLVGGSRIAPRTVRNITRIVYAGMSTHNYRRPLFREAVAARTGELVGGRRLFGEQFVARHAPNLARTLTGATTERRWSAARSGLG